MIKIDYNGAAIIHIHDDLPKGLQGALLGIVERLLGDNEADWINIRIERDVTTARRPGSF